MRCNVTRRDRTLETGYARHKLRQYREHLLTFHFGRRNRDASAAKKEVKRVSVAIFSSFPPGLGLAWHAFFAVRAARV
jgi:hypothetical protein